MNYLDSHCHLNDEAFNDDLNCVLKRMADNQVNKAMIISCNVKDYLKAKNIEYPGISFKKALGVYPEDCQISEEAYEEYVHYIREKDCIAVGEIGLDYYWYKDNKEEQKAMFIRQIELAKSLNKPTIVHSRDAAQDTYDILKAHRCRGVIHCYSGSKEMARELIKLGYYISFAGTITFKNAKEPLAAIKEVPLDKLLVETDCPYLTPVPHRGKRNEPAYVIHTSEKLAAELGIGINELMEQININYERIFGGNVNE